MPVNPELAVTISLIFPFNKPPLSINAGSYLLFLLSVGAFIGPMKNPVDGFITTISLSFNPVNWDSPKS